MIAHLQGELTKKEESYIIIDIQGVGYKVNIPFSLHNRLPEIGEEIQIHTHTYVREDRFVLYGFLKMNDLDLFTKLLGVSRIGPKGAINILSTLSVNEFKLAIAKEDIKTLKEAKGIGKKTAQRLILELKGKIDLEKVLKGENDDNDLISNSEREEAIEGLLGLGYNMREAQEAVKVACQGKEDISVEEIIKSALQSLA
ncbi:Holliday junction branch migration protein RuvA [Selenihalanaerobacter shriftii]|uniref:Holliday junction branch migration complex subunit RuvA n=1 Tax=Selenihalanaerobacter shriftii TaxID=142842 RepID=A0A1T4MZ58_9FIRM|nr:Holliday junction branch migration protein RuvA [Selenihalanaerobacter shriftii]SJZ72067.1 Holliday junction DNA helicase subunit RuvA [Selenihalanaerobacter shriftii]